MPQRNSLKVTYPVQSDPHADHIKLVLGEAAYAGRVEKMDFETVPEGPLQLLSRHHKERCLTVGEIIMSWIVSRSEMGKELDDPDMLLLR
jgi:hypothetical protein